MPHHASARRSSRRPGPAAGARFARYGGLWPSAVLASSSSSAATMSTRPTTSAPPRSAQADPTADVETGTPTTGESVRPRTYLLDVDESTTVLRAAPPRSSARRVATEGVKRGWLDARPSSPEGRAEREGQHSRSRPSDAPTGLKGGRSPTPDQLRGLPRSSELSRRLPTGKPAVTAHVAPRVRLAVAEESRVFSTRAYLACQVPRTERATRLLDPASPRCFPSRSRSAERGSRPPQRMRLRPV